ncbi:repressor LexA [Aliifodinibius salicampi]|uniref:Repressor LexA n=1 Tax=Fodinibius salicampi TaxID=1920655 RepID=A0ABT3PWT4_9BACT|nr:S24 family peptidase [Fodinibius salicampi]MCW9712324.1 repressor LexA [Fodinibius salicampi]
MITKDLTNKQSKFFRHLLEYARDHGNLPSYQTIMEHTWITSKNGVHQYFKALCDKNYLQSTGWGGYELHPSKQFLVDSPENPIPIRGIITAGAMQEAVDTDLGSLSIRNLFPQAQSPYCVRVSGTSMEEAGIHDGDLVILDDSPITDGDIGAILYDGQTTLKEIRKSDRQVVLYPKSSNHRPIIIEPDEFEEIRVLGKYIAHFHDGKVRYVN